MSGKNSAEYKAFFCNQAQIADTISDINGLNDIIVAKLRAMKIIGKTVRDSADIRGPQVTERQRVQPVLDAVLIKIELNKDVYYKFRDVLLSSEPGLKKLLPQGVVCENCVCVCGCVFKFTCQKKIRKKSELSYHVPCAKNYS